GAFAVVCAGVAAYNYARFGSVAEFGLHYLLSGPNQNRLKPAAANVLPGLYYFLGCSPNFSAVFPWARLRFRYPFDSTNYPFPPEYFYEPVVGALYLAPVIAGCLLFPPKRLAPAVLRMMLGVLIASSGVVLLFLAATGFTTQRYVVDFLPM